jgi:hypothetical protein
MGLVAHACNPSTLEAELHEFEASLGDTVSSKFALAKKIK